ncbi:lamin tail domain-containing protein [Actinocorallia sp. A-T 12471]|uniref:lamin tail domain-containing protein n=1 Tax=Actinocorallia sp. A-T 12471 TaxID=3089813 RepID=UPI0029D3DDA2|nr:lamin tail domain-containing protein [Actinocorallia sp. A-T 12471]MDX6743376.1 lamin tail domain-containing protein [Actinocorallia sp. A-T 12471]
MATPHATSTRTSRLAWLLAAASLPVALAVAPPAHAASADLVIAEVYGGGGNSGAILKSDFIELANAGTAPFDLTGYSLQYAPANPGASTTWQVTRLTGSVAPGKRFLVKQADGTSTTSVPLPSPDLTGTIALAAGAGTVALVAGTAPLTCKTAADCAADGSIKDLVGYGAAVIRETSPTGALGANASAARGPSLADTDDNSADLRVQLPNPTNAAGETYQVTPNGGTPPTEPGDQRIRDVQGKGRISPYDGKRVEGVPGVVTAAAADGFWIQDTAPDRDDATSEGIYVYTGAFPPGVLPGDSVLVSGTVKEYWPTTDANQTLTELTDPASTVLSEGNPLPKPVPVALPERYTVNGYLDNLALKPSKTALDWLEAREGMLVSVADVRVVGATAYGEIWVQTKPKQNPSERGGTVYAGYDKQNSGRIQLHALGTAPKVDVGDTLKGVSSGPLHYQNYGGYSIHTTVFGTEKDGGIKRQVVAPLPANSKAVGIATYNVENLSARDAASKFEQLAEGIVHNLGSPDIVALEEIQDNTGTLNGVEDPTVAADQTLAKFTAAIQAAGGPAYEWRQIDPVAHSDGGAPGGNIRQVFLFNPARGVTFVDRPGGDATTPVKVVTTKTGKGGKDVNVSLSVSPGRIDPASTAWNASRKPLVGEFTFQGRQLFVIANHFNSKGGDQPLHGRNQPPVRITEAQRLQQAALVNAFVDDLSKASKNKAEVVVLGDINDFEFSQVMDVLTGKGKALKPLIETLRPDQRYSYIYDGNSQALDHILLSPSIRNFGYGIVHINVEFADKASDHDPQLVRLLEPGKPGKPGNSGLPYLVK